MNEETWKEQYRRLAATSAEISAAKDKQIAALERWKREAMEITLSQDIQAIGDELELKIGTRISDKILPAIQAFKRRIQELEARLKEATESNMALSQQLNSRQEGREPTE